MNSFNIMVKISTFHHIQFVNKKISLRPTYPMSVQTGNVMHPDFFPKAGWIRMQWIAAIQKKNRFGKKRRWKKSSMKLIRITGQRRVLILCLKRETPNLKKAMFRAFWPQKHLKGRLSRFGLFENLHSKRKYSTQKNTRKTWGEEPAKRAPEQNFHYHATISTCLRQ